MLKYVITGTGRCGTGYIAQVFKSAGIPCGHEAIFSPVGEWIWRFFATNLQAESSWLTAPFLDMDSLKDVTVIHLVRNPRKTIESLMSVRVLIDDTPYSQFAFRHLPELRDWKQPEEQTAFFYLGWNRMIEPYAPIRWRVEDDPRKLLELLDIHYGGPLYDNTTYNHRPEYPPYELDWLALDNELRDEVVEMGQRYGYL